MKRLERRPVERIWGRRNLPAGFADCRAGDAPVGEIWFEDGARHPLLVKYLFTSERLSIQVHPDDRAARARGYPCGKDEAWLVLDAEPGAVIGLGLKHPVSRDALREAARDGGIEALVDWRPVRSGDSFYSPAGTIHAIGAGLSLVEIQQNVDLTYRFYDYGRPRALQLEEALEVARRGPFGPVATPVDLGPGRQLIAAGPAFAVERWTGRLSGRLDPSAGGSPLLIPLSGTASVNGQALEPGSAWRVDASASLAGDGELLVAYPRATAAS